MVIIEVVEVANGRYQAWHEGELICTSRTPFFSAARKLLEHYGPNERLCMQRSNGVIALEQRLGDAADLTVRDIEGKERFIPSNWKNFMDNNEIE